MIVKEGYCEAPARGCYRVITFVNCANKAKYKITFHGKTLNVCGTHLRQYYNTDWDGNPIKGTWLRGVELVIDLKTNKVIYNRKNDKGRTS